MAKEERENRKESERKKKKGRRKENIKNKRMNYLFFEIRIRNLY
jgi:hypothetical protein